MWMSLADRPAPISRWHDGKWTDMPAPFDASAVSWLLPDDQGRVVVQASSGRHSFHLVDKDAATGYDQLTDAIAAAVGKGARRFFSASGYPQCLVMDDGKIWLVQTNYGGLEYYDGKRWDSFRMDSERIVRLERDTTYSVVVCMESGKRFAYDRGQFVRLPDGEPAKQEHHDGPPVFPSTRGGCWTKPSSPEPFKRSFGGTEFACDFEQTPFPRGFTPGLIVEDAGGNLWITAWGARNWRRLFVKEMSGFKLATGELPKRAAGSLVLDVKVMLDEKSQEGWRLFYRLDDGAAQGPEWRGGELGPALKIEFPDDGTYEVEVIGMDPLGGTTPESVKFTVTSAKE
jgi:hypothetical protein